MIQDTIQQSLNQLKQQLALVEHLAKQSQVIPVTNKFSSEQEILIKLYNEFIATEEGKPLAANLKLFGEFIQSKQEKK